MKEKVKKRKEEKVRTCSNDQGVCEKVEYHHVAYIKVEEDNVNDYHKEIILK